jgi:hypothetical protein
VLVAVLAGQLRANFLSERRRIQASGAASVRVSCSSSAESRLP